jgi:hypothetical protein
MRDSERVRLRAEYQGLARFVLFALIAELLLGTSLPRALHLLLSWGLSGLLLFGVLRGTEDDDDQGERKQRRNWAIALLMVPVSLLAIGYALDSVWLFSVAGGALATPGLFAIVLLLFARPFNRQSHLEVLSLRKRARRDL